MAKLTGLTIVVASVLAAACTSVPPVAAGTLSCKHAYEAGSFVGLYSFREGELSVPPVAADRVDMVYTYDGDDCRQGALIGHDDRPGYLFPVGYASWDALRQLPPPSQGDPSVAAIAPLGKALEGFAFWVRSADGDCVLVRLTGVEAVSHVDLVAGAVPRVEFEWWRPGTR